jgi:hypothetical protein
MDSPPPPRLTNAQVFLGLFILWQLFFLAAANACKIVENVRPSLKGNDSIDAVAPGWTNEKGHVHDAEEVVNGLTKRWAELTGQPQSWSLFSPNVAEHIPFVAVEFQWEDSSGRSLHPPVLMLSDNEPTDPQHFFRIGRARVRKYESYLDVVLKAKDQPLDEVADVWRERIEERVRKEWDAIHVYLQWRRRTFQDRHPELPPPRQAILMVRLYRVPAPNTAPRPWMWETLLDLQPQPLARWQPEAVVPDGSRPVEIYNPVVRRFEYFR